MSKWFSPSKPKDISSEPWLHPSAIDYFGSILKPHWLVLEHGAGGSTVWLAERTARVVTVENSLAWRLAVREKTGSNVTILESMPQLGNIYDLFFIDGEREMRGYCIANAHKYIRLGGWLVLDNANRPEYAEERNRLDEHFSLDKRFDNNVGNTLYIVTEFWRCESA